ncbi:hypothetical protein N7472_008432 [Penicillium cf. griseofulvum]|uniref:Uncharacterized protein n=1 Tax=Penicillium cf. griseofulvum TaxID=2972120 RepID=A0A9W9J2I4_9EURO|nr:hypothetical protein N7472_008432 [Penicillium cf. griseofulvum]KAJ5452986.1 hypothetical protein N7445_001169 [Penicillium cf. griseofulvum]
MSMILGTLEVATCFVIWVVVCISSGAAVAIKNKLSQTKKRWIDDKKRLLAESRAIFDRETYLIEHLHRGQDQMIKGVFDADSLSLMNELEKDLDRHRFKIRQNCRELADLLDRHSD